jgi:outer membrane lipoprotein carrier protein
MKQLLHTRLASLLCALPLLAPLPGLAEEPAGAAAASQACGQKATEAVQRRYRDVQDIRADFVQTSRAAGPGGREGPTASSGTVVLEVPGKMRWTYEKPEKSLLVSDGKVLWLYDPAFGEAQKLPVTDEGYLTGAAIQFLLGKGDLNKEFDILTVACDATQAELRLTPREAASYEFLTIWVDPSEGLINRTEIADLLGTRTLVEFHNVALNQKPDASEFRFEPPAGVSVVELSPTP